MKLIPIHQYDNSIRILWDLLEQREPSRNISHKEMPSWEDHETFCLFHPYAEWNIIDVDGEPVGAIYLSKDNGPSVASNEIGIDIFKAHQAKGYGAQAVKLLMEARGPKRFIANVSPNNEASQVLFKSLGFKLCQHTYSYEGE